MIFLCGPTNGKKTVTTNACRAGNFAKAGRNDTTIQHATVGGNKIIVYMVLFEPMELYSLRFVASFVPANAFLLLLEAQVYNVYGTQTPPSHEKMRRKAREKREHF